MSEAFEMVDMLDNPIDVGCLAVVSHRDLSQLSFVSIIETFIGKRGNEVNAWVRFKSIPTEEHMKSIVRWCKAKNVLLADEHRDIIMLKKLSVSSFGKQEEIVTTTYPGHIITGIMRRLHDFNIHYSYDRKKNSKQLFKFWLRDYQASEEEIKEGNNTIIGILEYYGITSPSFEYYENGYISSVRLN